MSRVDRGGAEGSSPRLQETRDCAFPCASSACTWRGCRIRPVIFSPSQNSDGHGVYGGEKGTILRFSLGVRVPQRRKSPCWRGAGARFDFARVGLHCGDGLGENCRDRYPACPRVPIDDSITISTRVSASNTDTHRIISGALPREHPRLRRRLWSLPA